MAWDFQYCLTLDLSHFSIDPDEISARITHLNPRTARVGDQRVMSSGATRRSTNSVWSARLHDSEFLHSESHDFGNTLRACLTKLTPHGELFREVRQCGYAYLQIVFFSDSNHSVGIVPADVLATCGSLGLDLDLEYYAPNEAGPREST
jgi:hypothetical protein